MTDRQALLDFPGAEALRAAGRVEPPSARTLARAAAAVDAAIRDEAATGGGSAAQERAGVVPFRRRRLVTGRRAVATVLAAAAVAAGAAVYADPGAGASAGRAPGQARAATAATFLEDTAKVAAALPASSGRYWRMHLRTAAPGGGSRTFDEYVSRSMHYSVVARGHTFTKPQPGVWKLGPRSFGWKGLDALPADPAALLKIMNSSREYAGQSAFIQAGTLLGGAPSSPGLRAALYGALARMDGVKLVGPARDSAGRKGTELVFSGVASTDYLIIDPRTSALLETRSVTTKGRPDPVDRTTYLSVGPADRIG
ncbi:hypothetical protein [Streptomyces sp. NPDC001380]|uniref:hypothetical protein n=1 Tax=Streptomyces sp. NPDC001380 TaxID=3364566 RepID=UPI003687E6BA